MRDIYDINDDEHGAVLSVLNKEYNTKLIKTASESPRTFAWDAQKRFPIDTVDDIAMSYLYLQKTASKLSSSTYDKVLGKIKEAADFNDLNLEQFHKKRVQVAEISPDQFAVSIPVKNLPENMKEKCANFVYNNHVSFYPLNTDENIDTANAMFPDGLEDFPQLQPVVAQRIASLVPESKLSPKVKEFVPFSKSAMLEELSARDTLSKHDKGLKLYNKIAEDFSGMPDTLENRNKMYKLMKAASSHYQENPKYKFASAEKFLCGWNDDVEVNTQFVINKHNYTQRQFVNKAAELAEFYPEMRSLTKNASHLKDFLEDCEDVDLDLIDDILRNKI